MGGRGLWRQVVALPLSWFAGMQADVGEVGQQVCAAEGCDGWWLPYLCLSYQKPLPTVATNSRYQKPLPKAAANSRCQQSLL